MSDELEFCKGALRKAIGEGNLATASDLIALVRELERLESAPQASVLAALQADVEKLKQWRSIVESRRQPEPEGFIAQRSR